MVLCAALMIVPAQVLAQDAVTYSRRNLTVETALKAAQAALKKCRDSGWQVAVVDRSGAIQESLEF